MWSHGGLTILRYWPGGAVGDGLDRGARASVARPVDDFMIMFVARNMNTVSVPSSSSTSTSMASAARSSGCRLHR